MATIKVVVLGNENFKNNIKNLDYLNKLSSKITYSCDKDYGFNIILIQILKLYKISGLEKLFFVFPDGICRKARVNEDKANTIDLEKITNNEKAFLVMIPCEWQYKLFKTEVKVSLAETIIRI